jgi:uncharacterized C2H2 Zn-finger protein
MSPTPSHTGYACFFPDCTHTAADQVALHDHHQSAHTNLPLHRCPIPSCPSSTSNEIFTHTSHFETHMATAHPSYQFPCELCAAEGVRGGRLGKYDTYGALKKHQELVHGLKATWTCGKCGEVVGKQKLYVSHLKKHKQMEARGQRKVLLKARREEEDKRAKAEQMQMPQVVVVKKEEAVIKKEVMNDDINMSEMEFEDAEFEDVVVIKMEGG